VNIPLRQQLRLRLTFWYVLILGCVLAFYVVLVFVFQYASIKRQIYHDEIQDVETVEGLLYFDTHGSLKLQQDYFSHPRSRLLIDRLMEVRDMSGAALYRSDNLNGQGLGGKQVPGEGEENFNERADYLRDGTHVLLISHTHPVQGKMLLIRLGYSLAPFRERMRQFLGILLIALPATLLLAGLAGYLIAKRAFRPLEQMAARAETISSSNLNDRLQVENPQDELGHMARVLNHLLERLEQAFAQLQRFTADAAHELRTPLAAIRSVGELTLGAEKQEMELYRDALGSILEEAAVLNQTIEDLLLLAKAEAAQPGAGRTTFSLIELTAEVLTVLEVLLEDHELSVDEKIEEGVPVVVHADRGLVRAAFMNVLHNAVKFSPPHSAIRVNYSTAPGMAEVSIEDEGPGITHEERDLVFERFYTSGARQTSSKAGSGIGLSIARLAILRNGGEIFFDPLVSRGARCIIRLPLGH
jgi:signal transduction histidine kinase